ncbi:MAG: DUF1772 domain-containing protein, partial [Acetobacteraceae bacterium]|nr:DUF1772 domain-containing protein [Acetobacteraceae bacterium]
MEQPGKLRLDGPAWLTVQQNLYVAFGPFAAIVEPLSILLMWCLVVLLRGQPGRRGLALFAALSASIGLVVWTSVVSPMNARLNGWTAATLPADWTATRARWELGHAIHAALFGAAFSALIIEAVLPRKPTPN